MTLLLSIQEAADLFAVSRKHIQKLIDEADTIKNPRWRWGKELIELTPKASGKRVIRVNVTAFCWWTEEAEAAFHRTRQAKAHSKVGWAVKTGELAPVKDQTCSLCANPAQEYHHPDYAEPLTVQALCTSCHRTLHRRLQPDS